MGVMIETVSPDYSERVEQWRTMRDIENGVDAIKRQGVRYLPQPNASDTSDENMLRYLAYKQRAQWLPVTERTIASLVGAVFSIGPSVTLPPEVEYMQENCDGAGQSLEQFSKHVVQELLVTGRGGIMADYPTAEEGLSQEEVSALGLAARLSWYTAESIENWRVERVGSVLKLIMVKLKESKSTWKDDFTETVEYQYRVLIMRDGIYHQEIYDKIGNLVSSVTPRKSDGSLWTEIPFQFVGSKDNGATPTLPPLYGLGQINIGHYRNSADYEESAFITGQPTLFLSSDLPVDDFEKANPNGVLIGSRRGHMLGGNGKAMMLQAEPNSLVRQAMVDKEQQMIAIGARLVVQQGQNETAEAARIRAGAEISVLSVQSTNASEAMEKALEWSCMFMGGNPDAVEFHLNKEFFQEALTAQDVAQLMGLVSNGDIARSDMRNKLRKSGWLGADRTDEVIDADVASDGLVGGNETDLNV